MWQTSLSLSLRHTQGTAVRKRKIAKETGAEMDGERWRKRSLGVKQKQTETERKKKTMRLKCFLSVAFVQKKMPCKYDSSKRFMTLS